MKPGIVNFLVAALLALSAVGAAGTTFPGTAVTSKGAPLDVWYVTYHGRNAYPTNYYLFSSDYYYNRYGGYYRYYDSVRERYYYRYYDLDYYYYDYDGRRYCHYFYYE